jgi:MFS family permease
LPSFYLEWEMKMWRALKSEQRRRFIEIVLLALCYGTVLGHTFFVPRLVHHLGGTTADASILAALSLIPILFLATAGKKWVASLSPAHVVRLGLAISTLAFMGYSAAPSVGVMMAIALLQGLGYGLTFSRLIVAATTAVPSAYYGAGVAYVTVALQIGNGLGSFVASLLEPVLGHHHLFWVAAALTVFAQLLAGCVGKSASVSPQTTEKLSGLPLTEILRIVVLLGVVGLAFSVPLQFVPQWLASVSPQSALHGVAPAYFISTSFMAIVFGRLAFGSLMHGARQVGLVAGCFAVLTLALIALAQAGSAANLAAVAFVYGVSYSALYPCAVAYALTRGDESSKPQRSAYLMLGFELGTKLLPLALAFIADHKGFPAVFYTLSATVLVAGCWHLYERLAGMAVSLKAAKA